MRQSFDPLTFIPSTGAIRKHLVQTEALAKRLRVLLRVAERIEATASRCADKVPLAERKGAKDGR
jgi:hypothetical protein